MIFKTRKQIDFMMMLLFIHRYVKPSMNLSYTQLTEAYFPFISTNQWHHQVISTKQHKLKLKYLLFKAWVCYFLSNFYFFTK